VAKKKQVKNHQGQGVVKGSVKGGALDRVLDHSAQGEKKTVKAKGLP